VAEFYNGYIKIHRKITESSVYLKPPIYWRVFEWLIMQAFFQNGKKIKRGEKITSLREISYGTYWYEGREKRVLHRTTISEILKWLIDKGMLHVFNYNNKNRRETHYKIINYSDYQDEFDSRDNINEIRKGYIKVYRSILQNKNNREIYRKPPIFWRIYERMILEAFHRESYIENEKLRPGENIAGFDKIRQWVGWYEDSRFVMPTKSQIDRFIEFTLNSGLADFSVSKNGKIHYKIKGYEQYQYKYQKPEEKTKTQVIQINAGGDPEKNNNIPDDKAPADNNTVSKYKKEIDEVIDYFNDIFDKQIRKQTTNHCKRISARLKEGFTVDECKQVIDIKSTDPYFIKNPKFQNIDTLFRPGNFEKYLNETCTESNETKKAIDEVLNYLNEKAKKSFSLTNKSHRGYVKAILKAGKTVEDCKHVIDNKLDDPFFRDKKPELLRPSTLFSLDKFDEYLNEKPRKEKVKIRWDDGSIEEV